MKFAAGLIVLLALVIFLLSNRVPVTIGFWPLGTAQAWLGPVVEGALALGFFLGLLAGLPGQFYWRRRARAAEKRLAAPPPERPPPLSIPQ
ncbi:lipopolysaccharide assembly protein LapA domain-containing protein [Acidocella sp.]|uniref:lipopolysaccharide assembly protein LapA domain-containing protein n=1 Tax=Acidocella sp. TaxID=50710 RepID=UPI002638B1F6|nr:lipopolysaccharide assembly protein LapA domain-containing protein [Acidocella sp.]